MKRLLSKKIKLVAKIDFALVLLAGAHIIRMTFNHFFMFISGTQPLGLQYNAFGVVVNIIYLLFYVAVTLAAAFTVYYLLLAVAKYLEKLEAKPTAQ